MPVHRVNKECIPYYWIKDKLCSLMDDFNTDLLKTSSIEDVNTYYITLLSHFFTPYTLQSTRPIPKSLLDNILINSMEFLSHSGNLTLPL